MTSVRGTLRSWLVVCAVNLMWAAEYPAYKVASDHMSVAALSFWTFVIATGALVPFLWHERQKRTTPRTPAVEGWLDFLLLGTVGLIPPSVLLAWGIAHATAANGAILALTIPVLMTIMGTALLGERPSRFYLVCLALALAGTVVISREDFSRASFGAGTLAGNAAILAAAGGSAFYNTYGKKVMRRFTELEALVYGYVVAIVMCGAISIGFDDVPLYASLRAPVAAWIGVFVLGAVSWGIAMVMWMWLLKRLAVAQASVSVYLLPVFGLLLSAAVVGENVTLRQAVGGMIVLVSAYLSTRPTVLPRLNSLNHRRL